jgi:NAD(P)-dependent dehydrogenase (short-subunit alcohol dehydrogenase family)
VKSWNEEQLMDSNNFKGKFGIITGAAKGIGFATAKLLAARGAGISLVDIDVEQLKKGEKEIKRSGGLVSAFQADASQEIDVDRMVKDALNAFGTVDFLVNNVGILRHTGFLDLDPAEWDEVININLRSAYLCCRMVLPHMMAKRKGVIVNVSSQAGRSYSHFGGVHYTASKAGLLGLTRHLALEMAGHGIRVNAICPGVTMTPMVTSVLDENRIPDASKNIPLGRLARPEEQAAVIAFLLSDESSFITGASIDSNGGLFML